MSNSVQTPGKVQPKTNSTWAAPVDITLTSYLIFAGKFIKIPHYTIDAVGGKVRAKVEE